MGCGASSNTVAVDQLQRQLKSEEQKHQKELKKLQNQLEQERSKSSLKSVGNTEAASEPCNPAEPHQEPKQGSKSQKTTASKSGAKVETPKAAQPKAGTAENKSQDSEANGGQIHVRIADLVDKFIEGSGVKQQLAAAIMESMPTQAAAGDFEAAQTALREASKENFIEFTAAATDRIAEAMAVKAKEMSETANAAKTAFEVNSKYAMEDGMVDGAFGDVGDFLKGVEGIGLPQPEPLKGMEMEFTHGPDADDEFTTSNYGTTTTPAREWDFVTAPFTPDSVQAHPQGPMSAWKTKHVFTGGRQPQRLRVLLYAVSARASGADGLSYEDLSLADKADPGDDLFLTEEEKDLVQLSVLRFAKSQLDARSLGIALGEADDALVARVRSELQQALSHQHRDDDNPIPRSNLTYKEVVEAVQHVMSASQLSALVAHFRARLASAQLSDMEVMAMRLYTGPPFLKVNSVLRAWSGKFPEKMTQHLKGNKYVNTIHVAVSGLTKLQKVCVIPAGRKAYRGMAGVRLPKVFWEADELRAKGGVDFGFMSTTTEKEVAVGYIPAHKQLPIIFEIELGCIDRGSSLSFLSQYPEEDEILFPPLSYLETTGPPYMEGTSKGDVIVMPARVNCNLKGKTVEEVAARRKEEHLSMREYLGKEMRRDLDALSELLRGTDLLSEEELTSLEASKARLDEEYERELEEIRTRGATWFNRDDNYKRCITGGIDFKAKAIAQLLEECQLPLHELASGKVADKLSDDAAAALIDGLLALGANTELKEEDELKTLLHVACEEGTVDMARLLVKYGADMEARDQSYRQTPLLFAADKGSHAIVRDLLASGASVDAVDSSKYNVMHKAAGGGHWAVMAAVLEHLKAEGGDEKRVKVFLDGREDSQWTPLMHACSSGHLATAKYLLDQGADLSLLDDEGRSALHHAAEDSGDDCLPLVQLLLDRKADPNKRDKDRNLPLHSACSCGDAKVVKLLLDLDPAKVNVKGPQGQTPLHLAAVHNQEMVEVLLERGADEKLRDKDGKLASKVAKESDEKKIFKLLKAKEDGADWTALKKKPAAGSDDDDDDEEEEEEEEEEEADGGAEASDDDDW